MSTKYITIIFRFSLVILISFLLYSCASAPRFTLKKEKNEVVKIDKDTARQEYFDSKLILKSIEGYASYYADDFNGKMTSNGEIYKMYGLTAAHNSFPFNTIIRVTNLKNNRKIIVRINDRMPLHPERLIDLSYGSAILLDMLKDGVVKVRLEILEWGN